MSSNFRDLPYNISMGKFCERLKELRKDLNLSQQQLASIIGTNNSSVCDWERGRSQPDIETIIKLCKLFQVSADYLLGIED